MTTDGILLLPSGTGELRIYIDGAEAATAVSDGNRNIIALPGVYPTIGGGGFFGDEYFTGLIDELQIFDRTLTAAEIVAAYNACNAGLCQFRELIFGDGFESLIAK